MSRPTETEAVDVWRGDVRVGRLARTRDGAEFAYDEEFVVSRPQTQSGIAFHLPYATRRFLSSGVNLHPFFAGLLPEGLRLSAVIRRVKTSPDDLFSLLVAVGSDCIGDVAITEIGEPLADAGAAIDVSRVESEDFELVLRKTMSSDDDGIFDKSLPGVQEKISAAMISMPIRGKKSLGAWILKLNPPDREKLVEQEEFFLRMASDCGLVVNDARIVRDRANRPGLLVERFDRWVDKKGKGLVKVAQEDGCQFLDRYPADKYRITAREIADGIAAYAAAPIVETLRFLELYAFSYLIGNGDMHAKNVSLRRSPKTGLVELSPAYDLLSTLPYRGLDQRMAMRLDAKDDGFTRKSFIVFGARYGVRESAIHASIDRLVERSEPWIDRIAEIGFSDDACARVVRGIKERRKRLVRAEA